MVFLEVMSRRGRFVRGREIELLVCMVDVS